MAESHQNPDDRRYTSEHEWIKQDGSDFLVGITSFAQDQLGDIVYVELPKAGDRIEAGRPFGVVESVKTASDLYAPVSGAVVEVNPSLTSEPQTVNDDPYVAGWMIRVRPDDASEVDNLMTARQYAEETGA